MHLTSSRKVRPAEDLKSGFLRQIASLTEMHFQIPFRVYLHSYLPMLRHRKLVFFLPLLSVSSCHLFLHHLYFRLQHHNCVNQYYTAGTVLLEVLLAGPISSGYCLLLITHLLRRKYFDFLIW